MGGVVRSCWTVVLPEKRFYMVGDSCTHATALARVRLIWPSAEVE